MWRHRSSVIRVWECWSSVSPVFFTNTATTWLTLHPASPGHQRLPLAAWWDCPRSASSAVCEDRKRHGWTWWRQRGEKRKKNWNVSAWILQGVAAVSLIDKSAVKFLDSLIRRVSRQYKDQRNSVCIIKIRQTHFYIWEARTWQSMVFVSIIEKQTRFLCVCASQTSSFCWLLQSPHEADCIT